MEAVEPPPLPAYRTGSSGPLRARQPVLGHHTIGSLFLTARAPAVVFSKPGRVPTSTPLPEAAEQFPASESAAMRLLFLLPGMSLRRTTLPAASVHQLRASRIVHWPQVPRRESIRRAA